jgi:uncharacterized linocin/CFP29 family protein
MNHLRRELAPVSDEAWAAIDEESERTLKHFLTARRLVDFAGPEGWTKDAAPHGHVGDVARKRPRVSMPVYARCSRCSSTAPSFRSRVQGSKSSTAALETSTAMRFATRRVGSRVPRTRRCSRATPRERFGESRKPHIRTFRSATTTATTRSLSLEQSRCCRRRVIAGPYAVALGPRCYTGVIETTEMGGYPVLEHLRLIAGGPVLWASAIDGAVVLSLRGGDYLLTVGQGTSIGYLDHDDTNVHLYFEESFTFQGFTPDAAVHLSYQ